MRASSPESNKGEGPKDEKDGTQNHWGRLILSEAISKGPVLFSGTDWAVVPMDSLSSARRAIIHPISQRLAGVENTALVDGLFGRIWEFPKCENVRERKVTRGDQFVGDSRIDFQWNKTERTLCRVCGKHILKQKFATEHYQRSPTCWRLVMRHIGIPDFDATQGSTGPNCGTIPFKAEERVFGSPQRTPLENRNTIGIPRNGLPGEEASPLSSYISGSCQEPEIQGQCRAQNSAFIENSPRNGFGQTHIPTSNVEYILQNKIMNLFRAATKFVYEELIQFKGSSNEPNINPSLNPSSTTGAISKFDSSIVESVMSDPKDTLPGDLNPNTSEEPYLLISSVLPNIFPSISHKPLPVNVCYIKLKFNWPGARLVRDLWALDCELLVDWGDGVLTQARRFTLKELGEAPDSDNEMRNIYSQGFAYLKCFVPHKPPGRADLKIRIPKSLWEYWEAFANDKNNAVTFYTPEMFASEIPQNYLCEAEAEHSLSSLLPESVSTFLNDKTRRGDSNSKRSHPYSSSPPSHRPSSSPKSIGNSATPNPPKSPLIVENQA
ncbi:hypothetical protein HWI79_2618 [Cryptosporidium felis]|nr:hypothetical protein HWI79_2618 [Cryptosporidium felis]